MESNNKERSVTFRAPGRINIIGEHIDYNGGKVVPAAIDKYCTISMSASENNIYKVEALDLSELWEGRLESLDSELSGWKAYILGAMILFLEKGHSIQPVRMSFSSDVPVGAGLSSSAALSSAWLGALNVWCETEYSNIQLAKMAQEIEHRFAGVQCGIMDMFVALHGKKDQALILNTETLEFDYVSASMNGATWLLFDSQVKHSLADSEYNIRRKECGEALDLLNHTFGSRNELAQFQDLSALEIESCLDGELLKRVRHVLSEVKRVDAAVDALRSADYHSLGELLNQSHNSLANDYEVSCAELDIMVEYLNQQSGIFGCRMMGGGFGGCVLALCSEESVAEIRGDFENYFLSTFGTAAHIYEVNIGEGASLIH